MNVYSKKVQKPLGNDWLHILSVCWPSDYSK